MLSKDFPGRDSLLEQLKGLKVEDIADSGDDYGSLVLQPSIKSFAQVHQRVPVEAMTKDIDNMQVYVLLHVTEGLLGELEIYKADGTPLIRPPQPDSLVVTVRPV